jgi:flagellin
MALNVISNYAANVAHRYLTGSDADTTSSLAKLASGQRVVSARDDAASLAIGSRLTAQVQALKQASTNATQATSMLQVADGALSKISDILIRMKTLAVQAGSGQLGSTERSMINTEYQSLLSEVDRISNNTTFNGVTLLAGSTAVTTSLNGQTAAKNYVQAADGVQSVAFGVSSAGQYTLTYNSSTNVMTLKNLTTGVTQGVNIGASAIAVNSSQTVTFSTLDTVVTLNSAFDKAATIAPAAGTVFSSDSAGQVETTSVVLNSINAAAIAVITGNVVSIDASTGGAAVSTIKLTAAISGTADLSTTGTKTVSISDGTNTFNVSFNVTTAFTTNDNAASLTIGALGTVVLGTAATSSTSFTYKVGSGTTSNDEVTVTLSQITTTALSISGGTVTDVTTANTSSTNIDTAINTLNTARSNVGASQNRLKFAAGNLASAIENADAARSTLLDLDIAQEMTAFTSRQVLMQTGISMLAQANRIPQDLLKLFQ